MSEIKNSETETLINEITLDDLIIKQSDYIKVKKVRNTKTKKIKIKNDVITVSLEPEIIKDNNIIYSNYLEPCLEPLEPLEPLEHKQTKKEIAIQNKINKKLIKEELNKHILLNKKIDQEIAKKVRHEQAKTTDPKYFVNYYHENLSKKIKCVYCSKEISSPKMKRHLLTKICLKNRIGNQTLEINNI